VLSPADAVVAAYLILTAALIGAFTDRVSLWWVLLPAHLLVVLMIVLLARWPGAALAPGSDWGAGAGSAAVPVRGLSMLRFWYPLLLIPFTFRELSYLIPLIRRHDLDHQLAAVDYRLFGTDPVVWLSKSAWPPLTLLLQLSYLTYYFLPIVLSVILWRRGEFGRFHFFAFIVVLGFYASYIGYIAVPAIGPRFFLDSQVEPFQGASVQFIRQTLNSAEGLTRDCFPSGHTELTLLVLYCARRFEKRAFWVMLPPGLALIISTVYLRYHYAIDVIAGAVLAVAILALSEWLYNVMGGRLSALTASGIDVES